ncbi:MAG: ROK family protein [Coprobacillus sp.]
MYLVIDIGGTYTKYGYFYSNGNCLKKDKFLTITTDLDGFYKGITDLITDDVKGIAISMPGLIDSTNGYIEAITLLPFLVNHNIIKDLSKLTNLPISVCNDAKCAALGEMWKGNLIGAQNALLIVLGSGIGATIIMDNQVINSPHHKAGEIGSILMPTSNDYSKMTNFGAHNNANVIIKKLSQSIGCENNGETVFKLIHNHKAALDIFEQYCREIAFMIYNLDYILDLDIVCIGGGISEQPLLIQTIQQQFSLLRNQYKEDENEPIIKACLLHNDANLLGALSFYNKTKG